MRQFTQYVKTLSAVFFILALGLSGCSPKDAPPSGLVNVTLLQTTDMHNAAAGTTALGAGGETVQGGWARLAAKIKEIRTAKSPRGVVLAVDSGDYTMGTVYDLLWDTDPAPFRFLQEMQYDVITLGNHEFDYGPEKLATMINRARESGFALPIVATNTVFDGISGSADDGLEALNQTGVIITDYYIKTYPNGLKLGIIGLMGKVADNYSPNAPPVTFRSDYTDEDVKAFIQQKVDTLRNVEGVHAVIALSHSGITSPDTDPAGDDILLAQNITGIDIIASGHEHQQTNNVVPIVNGDHISYIICAGVNGTNLAELDFVVDVGTRKLAAPPTLTNHAITDAITEDAVIQAMVLDFDNDINTLLVPLGITMSETVATSLLDLGQPGGVHEFGLGNLLADAVRYAGTAPGIPTFGAFANGTIRGDFYAGQNISFADLFAAAPLGITPDNTQDPLLPGYPLLKVYLTGDEIWDMCKFDASIMAFQLYIEYFSSLAGLKYTYSGTTINDVQACAWDDYTCDGPTTAISKGTATLYPLIIDKYVMDMLLTQSVQDLLGLIGISLHPKLSDGTVIDPNNLMQARLDRDPGTPGIQEYYGWSAALEYFTDANGLNGTIPEAPYNLSVPRMIAQ